jgi:hypothetical protein
MSVLSTTATVARHVGLGWLAEMVKKRVQPDPRRYLTPEGPQQALPPDNFVPTELLAATEADRPSNPVFDTWMAVPSGHKWLHYFENYQELLGPLRDRPIKMLEIGVYRGASLELWRNYLHPASVIVGIDIDEKCRKFDRPADNVHVRIGSQDDPVFLDQVVREFGPFDLILDDGSHIVSHMIASFGHLFLPALAEHGTYIAEDTHTNFWPEYRDRPYSFIDLCKDLTDTMHSHYALQPSEPAYRLGSADRRASLTVPRIAAHIKEISFRDSIVVIRKKPAGRLPGSQHN